MAIPPILIFFIFFISVIKADIDLATVHWWIWVHGVDEKYNKAFTYNVAASYTASDKTIKYTPKTTIAGITEVKLTFPKAFDVRQQLEWNTQINQDGYAHVTEITGVKVSLSTTDNIVNKKVWIRPFVFDTNPSILFMGKAPTTHTLHYTIYKPIDNNLAVKTTKYWNAANVFTYIQSLDDLIVSEPITTSVRLKSFINDWPGIVLNGHGSFAYDDRPPKTSFSKDFYELEEWWSRHVKNLQKHFRVEFLWKNMFQKKKSKDIPGNGAKKIIDALDLIPAFDATYERKPSPAPIPVPGNIPWKEKDKNLAASLNDIRDGYGIHSYTEATNNNYLEIFNSQHHHTRFAREIEARLREKPVSELATPDDPFAELNPFHKMFQYAFIELDTKRAIAMNVLSSTIDSDMIVATKIAHKKWITNNVIMADCPTTNDFLDALLLYPYGYGAAPTGYTDVGPVVESVFYIRMYLTVRNMWIAYSINTIAADKDNKRFFTVVGMNHGARGALSDQRYFVQGYSVQNLLTIDNVVLPFVLKNSREGIKIRFNFDPSTVPPSSASAKYKGSNVIGYPPPGYYEGYRKEYRKYYNKYEPKDFPQAPPGYYEGYHDEYRKYHNDNPKEDPVNDIYYKYNSYGDNPKDDIFYDRKYNNNYTVVTLIMFIMFLVLIGACVFGIFTGWIAGFVKDLLKL